MKTKLLKMLRKEAMNRIGVFKQKDGKYRVVFDKGFFGDVAEYDKYPKSESFQVVYKNIENLSEARELCDAVRRLFILRAARKTKYGTSNRMY